MNERLPHLLVFLCMVALASGVYVFRLPQNRPGLPVSNVALVPTLAGAPDSGELSALQVRFVLDHPEALLANYGKERAFDDILRRWVESDAGAAFAWARSLGEEDLRLRALSTVGEALARLDPRLLAGKISSLPEGESRRTLTLALADVWSQSDLLGAQAWATQLAPGADRDDALFTIRGRHASADPVAASVEIRQLPVNSSTASLISTAASAWGQSDPAAAIAWAWTLSPDCQVLAMAGIADAWSRRDPAAAANFVVSLPAGEAQEEAIKAVLSNWAEQNPPQVAAWLLRFPPGDLRDEGMRRAITAWNDVDPAELQDWVSSPADAALRDNVLKNLVVALAPDKPGRALEIVDSIQSPPERDQALESLVRSWSQIDSKSARDWVAKSSMAEEKKLHLEAFIPVSP